MHSASLMQQRENLLNRLSEIYRIEQRGRIARSIQNPVQRLNVFIHNRLIYPATSKGKLVSAETFWNKPMWIQLPAAAEILLTGAKVHRSEIQLCKWLLREVRPTQTFIDGGAHYGFYSLLFSFLSNQSTVVSFEPLPSTCTILEKNKQPNQIIVNAALSDKTGFVFMSQPDIRNSEANEVIDTDSNESNRISCCALDDELMKLIVQPDYIKLDVEGHEYEALIGAKKTIEQSKPAIILEIWNASYRNNEKQLKAIEMLRSIGYILYLPDDDGILQQCNKLEQLNQSEMDSFNVILKVKS